METALHNAVVQTKNAIAHKEIALGVFLDEEGALDRTTFVLIMQAAE
jgi:hypothetical protein